MTEEKKTLIKKIDPEHFEDRELAEAVDILKNGGLVAFPTETVYGLGGNAFDSTASARIYAAKGRPSDNPLIVHISSFEEIYPLVKEVPEDARRLAERFWPGPLTMILEKSAAVPKETTGGLETVAIRMPSHKVANKLIKEAGIPIAAPSANASGRPSTTRAEHVIEDLDGKIDMIIDGGSSDIGLESTIVDLTVSPRLILRPGYVTYEMLKEVIGDIAYDPAVLKRERDDKIVAKAPGMKYRHYAPKGELTIFEGNMKSVANAVKREVREKLLEGFNVGILTSDELAGEYKEIKEEFGMLPTEASPGTGDPEKKGRLYIRDIGSRTDEAAIAAGLFEALRSFDSEKTDFIYAESFDSRDIGQAIMNRLMKAAGYRIVTVNDSNDMF